MSHSCLGFSAAFSKKGIALQQQGGRRPSSANLQHSSPSQTREDSPSRLFCISLLKAYCDRVMHRVPALSCILNADLRSTM